MPAGPQPNAVPFKGAASRPRRRFGTYPKAVAAQNIARSIRTSIGDGSEVAAFRDMLRATGRLDSARPAPMQDEAVPSPAERGTDHSPIWRVRYEPDEEAGPEADDPGSVLPSQIGPVEGAADPQRGGPSLTERPREREVAPESEELRAPALNNQELTIVGAPDSVPDAAAKSSPAEQVQTQTFPDTRDSATGLGFPPRVEPVAQAGKAGKAGKAGIETGASKPPEHRLPSYRVGESDGGPGAWVEDSKKLPKHDPNAASYQQLSTGAPQGTECKVTGVPKSLMPSREKYFDGYDPESRNLIDAKNYTNWPKEGFEKSMEMITNELRKEAKVAAHFGSTLEIRVATPEKAGTLLRIIEKEGIKTSF